ncbi:uncharacterized protein A1O9_02658 [Exophiala aquamarina CBS 119918]|uniref:Uncharacterized protein n=1 Tax=Exophiala aquamarina CBS 119918 TaxID=1182545 RepID=A0A072PP13_9EURO|nr:uncharacterized protein A1O9_02658 [Exophiala aquamarina CBS 119918]KEF61093.1 hypothetical protein A1O9_02658 [Exophiala aquamarina CBS 119918]
MAPPPGFAGKTQYNYYTKDGGPPNQGKPPGPPAPTGAPPPYSFLPQVGPHPAAQPGPFVVPPRAANPGMVCFPNGGPPPAPAPPQAPDLVWIPAAPAPPVGPALLPACSQIAPTPATVAQAAARGPEPPVTGNRIKDSLVILRESGGAGYIASKSNATFHVFNRGILSVYTPDVNRKISIPAHANESFQIQIAACSMPLQEFIEQLDCIKDAPASFPRSAIGIAQLVDHGDGCFEVGSRFMLDEDCSKSTIGQIFGNVGEAGLARPVYLTRLP